MSPLFRYAEMMRLSMQMGLMLFEAQQVIALRMPGMTGVLAAHPSENGRMLAEKGAAFAQSAQAATLAALQGKQADQVAMAALRPIRRKTRANAARLTRAAKQV
ncbi:antifreeze protein [Cereibacter changlensis JA139]|uniref:Antifreeze protein n=2 Tax=Cereibacter changlensis TaxID=402884 RepID=A0A2T4JW30_9RHOB|nr:antifreeze protein [Cereibacter changlensis]PTE21973.1 antifreeze protein [Cereibacter changlensis JA139]PZX54459.1 hypothetical protein LX76_02106 [Cereibacter changlensis]